MGFELNDLEDAGLDLQEGIAYTGSEEKLVSALWRYYNSSEKNKEKIRVSMESGSMEDLVITVHALKSNSKMIGAAKLAGMFEALERAATENDPAAVKNGVDEALSEYERLLSILKPLGETEKFKASDEISADEARTVSAQLLEALDEYDDELSAALVKKLSGYPFRITQKNLLREAAQYIDEFSYEDAAQIIRNISSEIE